VKIQLNLKNLHTDRAANRGPRRRIMIRPRICLDNLLA
jgi:hypothetical protein